MTTRPRRWLADDVRHFSHPAPRGQVQAMLAAEFGRRFRVEQLGSRFELRYRYSRGTPSVVTVDVAPAPVGSSIVMRAATHAGLYLLGALIFAVVMGGAIVVFARGIPTGFMAPGALLFAAALLARPLVMVTQRYMNASSAAACIVRSGAAPAPVDPSLP